MKKLLATAFISVALAGGAFAQDSNAEANSGSSSQAVSSSYSAGGSGGLAQQSQGQAIYLDQRAPSEQRITSTGTQTLNTRQSGTVRNEFAPAVQAPAMGSGHPCGLGNSVGVSIIGGGLTGGATRVDDACLLAQMGHDKAAMQMIAARNPSACRALVSSGEISPHSYCGDEQRVSFNRGPGVYNNPAVAPLRPQPQQGVAPVIRPNAGNVAPNLAVATQSTRSAICELKPGTKRTVITNAPTQQGKMACAASLGIK